MGFYLLYIMINLLGHIHKDGVSVTLNITRDRILKSNITPISISVCLCIVLMVGLIVLFVNSFVLYKRVLFET